MDKLLEDYKSYYASRAKRYAGNPIFKRSADAEKKLSDAMQSCNVLEEFKDKMGNLNDICSTAMLLDQSEYRGRIFNELKETVRAKGNTDAAEKCASITNTMELVRTSSVIFLENAKEIGSDTGTVTFFKGSLFILERIDVYENAKVPDNYKNDMQRMAKEEAADLKKSLLSSLENYRKTHPAFNFDWDGLWEHRHRKLIAIPDEMLTKRINQIKNILN